MCGLGRERRGVVGRPPHRRLKLLLEAGIEDQSDRWTCTLWFWPLGRATGQHFARQSQYHRLSVTLPAARASNHWRHRPANPQTVSAL